MGNPLNSRSIYWDTQLMIFFLFKFWALYCMCVCLFASLLSHPPGAKINGKRSLLIQGRMQIFEKKNLSFWCISSPGTYLERCAVKFWSNFHPELLILKTKSFPLCKNNENLEFWSQCHILLLDTTRNCWNRHSNSQAAKQPSSQPARQPASQAARQPASQAASQAAKQPASRGLVAK